MIDLTYAAIPWLKLYTLKYFQSIYKILLKFIKMNENWKYIVYHEDYESSLSQIFNFIKSLVDGETNGCRHFNKRIYVFITKINFDS